ncbi:MAG: hypothetical protein IPN44_02540 [Flavobacteriales bacterium]|nr:hypothetical protein [Flavobacteriales bacterium]
MFDTLRTTLLITLAILVLAIALRRYKQYIREKHTPVPRHAELLNVEVVYHPLRVHVLVRLPREEEVFPAVLAADHSKMLSWPAMRLGAGSHELEFPLDPEADGMLHFELGSSTQRTERRFMVRNA